MEKEHNFQKLTPINNVDLNIYEEALDFIFKNDDLVNVGISGPYSSGKSSVIETYKKKRPDKKFMHISLAHFSETEISKEKDKGEGKDTAGENDKDTNDKGKTDKGNEEYSNILEGKILNQLIHQIDSDNISQTNFRIKKKIQPKQIQKITNMLVAFVLCTLYVRYFHRWSGFVKCLEWVGVRNGLLWTTHYNIRLIALLLDVYFLSKGIYEVVKIQKNHNIFRRLNLQGNEIEICSQNDESFFDKYLNEVIYLFENSQIEVFIFEDLDRYNANQIFQRLREINTLINYRRKKEDLPPIRFLYLIKDDIFISKDRTKFFDFMIPIIPVIDGSNSYEQFTGLFREGGMYQLFDSHFLQDISLYVDDMRILKNIYNEFIVYYNRIKPINLDNNKLLAMIIYKNIFPRDFSDLQLGQGFVWTLFTQKSNFISIEMHRMKEKANELESMLKKIDLEVLETIHELDVLYFLPEIARLRVNGKMCNNFSSVGEFIQEMKDNPKKVQRLGTDYYSTPYSYDFEGELQKARGKTAYVERMEIVKNKSEGRTEEIRKELTELKLLIESMQKYSLKEIITKENVEVIFSATYINEVGVEHKFEEIKSSPYFDLIKYLIRHGYIDETYQEYMTYFYENSLSRNDKVFLRSVADEKALPYGYELRNPELVLTRLNIKVFNSEEVLNFSLINYMLEHIDDNVISYLQTLARMIEEKCKYEFIEEYWVGAVNKKQFVEIFNVVWKDTFATFLSNSVNSHTFKNEYVLYSIYHMDEETIESMNGEKKSLTQFISSSEDFLNICEPNIEQICRMLTLLEVEFVRIDFLKAHKELLNVVYQNNLYKLNFYMITHILENIYGITKSEDFENQLLTLMLSDETEPLDCYGRANLNECVEVAIQNCGKRISDSTNTILVVLNSPNVSMENKKMYLEYIDTPIEKVEGIQDKELWTLMFEQNKVIPTIDNILVYYAYIDSALNETLVKYINEQPVPMTVDVETLHKNTENWNGFAEEIAATEAIELTQYRSLLQNYTGSFEKFECNDLCDEKVDILIDLNLLKMTKDNLVFMRKNYPVCLYRFIQKKFNDYVRIMDTSLYVEAELLHLLEADVDDSGKIELLEFSKEKISIEDMKCSDTIKANILKKHFNMVDLELLCKDYNKFAESLRNVIRPIVIQNIDVILRQKYVLSYELADYLLSTVEEEKRQKIFVMVLPIMDLQQIRAQIKKLGYKDLDRIFEYHTATLEITEFNSQVLQILEKRKWISGYQEDKSKAKYRVSRKGKTGNSLLKAASIS